MNGIGFRFHIVVLDDNGVEVVYRWKATEANSLRVITEEALKKFPDAELVSAKTVDPTK